MPEEHYGSLRLDSWKTIAAYLQRDVRTVIRWEQTRGLPVRRMPGGTRSAVYAFKNEIDAWLGSQTSPLTTELPEFPQPTEKAIPKRRLSRRGIITAAASIVLFALTAFGYHHLPVNQTQPATATFTAGTLQAWDDHHQLLWEHRLPPDFVPTAAFGELNPRTGQPTVEVDTNRARIVDLYGDGRHEILTITRLRHGESLGGDLRQVLSCFSSRGKLLWEYEPQTVLNFGSRAYGAPWILMNLIVSDEPGRKTIWVIALGYTWGKSFVARLDADGQAAIQFVSSGGIEIVQRFHSPRGPMLWIGGFNDEYDTASLAIMPDTQDYAVSPQTSGGHYVCSNCASGDPLAYFVFPRYDMSRILHNPNNKIHIIQSNADEIEVHQAEISVDDKIIYDFSNTADPKPLHVNYSATFWPNHLELERQGKVDHPLAKCPDRLNPPPVRVYQNGQWRNVAFP